MATTINDQIYRDQIRRRAMLSLYERRLVRNLDNVLSNLNKKFVTVARTNGITPAILVTYNREIRRAYRRVYSLGFTEFERLYASEGKFAVSQINRSLTNIYEARKLTGINVRDLLIRDNKNLAGHLASISSSQRRIVSNLVRNGLSSSLSNNQIIGNIRRQGSSLARSQVATLARTSITQVANDASDTIYRLNDDVIKGYQYVATLDGRTSIICGRLDGRVFSLDSGFKPRPPQHFGCRSTTIPVVKSAGAIDKVQGNRRINKRNLRNITEARRASINGAVPARTTYPEWLATQDNEIKLNLLGSQSRVALFNEGNLTLTQFSNRDGKLLSLERLD
ncbi:MAG: minor capsid protein, partial [Bdellovibrionales bacterium]